MRIMGIATEVKACLDLATTGKHILRLPENIPDMIDNIIIDGKPYRDLLKFKPGSDTPRGYPDAYFDGQTWDFKTSKYQHEDSLRQTIKDGRKADNIVFLTNKEDQARVIQKVIHREIGMRIKDASWKFLPDIYYYSNNNLKAIWNKRQRG